MRFIEEPEPSLGNMLTAASDLDQLRSQPIGVLSPALAVLLLRPQKLPSTPGIGVY